jgi:hypothetical protein
MAKQSLVLELQELASNSSNDIRDLLRKALLVATKLKVDDFRDWIECELNGYGDRDVPDYRTTRAELKAFNPYRGYIPFLIKDDNLYDKVTQVELRESISSLVSLLDKDTGEGGRHLMIPFSNQMKMFLTEGQDVYMEPIRFIGSNIIARIIDAVRTMILDWSLKLESEGILGAGLSFSEEEKQKASNSPQIHIDNFQGILGDVAHSSVSQKLNITINKGDWEGLKTYLKTVGVDNQDIDDLKEAIKEDPQPKSNHSFGKKVGGWIGNMVTKAAQGLGQLPMGTSSSLLANAIWQYYGFGSI